jgi:hypothetical protein
MKAIIPFLTLLASVSTAGAGQINYPLNALEPRFLATLGTSVQSVLPGITTTVSAAYLQTANIFVHERSSDLLGKRVVGTLDPTVTGYRAVPIRFSFSVPIVSANFSYYDYGGDDDGNVIIAAYDASSTFLGSTSHAYGTSYGGSSGDIQYANASYFILSTTGAGNPNSLEWSILSVTAVTAVPEPSAAALFAGGLLLLVRQVKSPLSSRKAKRQTGVSSEV